MLFAVPGTAHADFAYDEVRMEVDKDVPEKGTLEELPVPTFGKSIKSYCEVYLPYGYDPDDKTTAYDVVIMLPGASGSWTTFFTESFAGMTGKEALDSVFYYKQAKPAIVVTTASFRTMKMNIQTLMVQYIRDIVRELDAHYNTYGNPEMKVALPDGEALRDHYVLTGFCYSADLLISVLIAPCSDLFSRFGVYSTLINTSDAFLKEIEKANREHPIRYIMTSSGTKEQKFKWHTDQFGTRMRSIRIPVYNFTYTGVEHDWPDNALASLYNVVQFMCPGDGANPLEAPFFEGQNPRPHTEGKVIGWRIRSVVSDGFFTVKAD